MPEESMKITHQSAEELELQEGSASGLIAGAAFVIAGILAAIYLRGSLPYATWIGLAAAALGVVVILMSSSITVRANKTSGRIDYQKKRLIGAQNSTFAIADVFRIETRKEWRMQNAPNSGDQNPPMQQPVIVAQSVIVFKDGRELALDHQKTSSNTSVGSAVIMSGQGAEAALAAQVAKFLGVPFAEIAPPNMGAGINIIAS
jgi:hypothetical protein